MQFKTISADDWKVNISDILCETDLEKLSSYADIISYINKVNLTDDFVWSIELKSIYYFLLIEPSKKTINIFSKNLFMESLIYKNDPLFDKIKNISIENSPRVIDYQSVINNLPSFNEQKFNGLEELVNENIQKISEKINEYKVPVFERLTNIGLDLTAKYELIRVHVLKFLALLPSLNHDKGSEVKRLFLSALRHLILDSKVYADKGMKLPLWMIVSCHLVYFVCSLIPSGALARIIRFKVKFLAKRFIAGVDIKDAKNALDELMSSNRSYTIDQLGELVVSNIEADDYLNKVLDIIEGIKTDKPNYNKAGINYEHISIKVSALCRDFKPHSFDSTYEDVYPRLSKILLAAKKANVFINIDAEHYHYRDLVFNIYKKTLLETSELRDYKDTGIVVQAYLKDSYKHLLEVIELAKQRRLVMPIRLVKGAYWDAETVEANAHGLESFQFLNKYETDINFKQLVYKTLENREHLSLAIASHNIIDHAFAKSLSQNYFDGTHLEHQCLHMTYEGLSTGLSKAGFETRNYIPVGDLIVGMAYLVRRIMENSSQVGILTMMRMDTSDIRYQVNNNSDYYVYSAMLKHNKTFKNINPIEEYRPNKVELIKTYIDKINLNSFKLNDENLSGQATSWNTDLDLRKKSLLKLSYLFQKNRDHLSALIMVEAKKTFIEATLDVDEAIDFINFYVKSIQEISNKHDFEALGTVGVIAPWNFPLAIAVGMSVAPLACGNKVILKPSEYTPVIVSEFIRLARIAGIDSSVLGVKYGDGAIGASIVDDESVDSIVFTGSKFVGMQIYKKKKGQISSKVPTVITEMGGKNAVIVTNNAELDETVSNLLYSTYAHAGQKCSASSRIIIDNNIKESFLKRFIQASKDIHVGPSCDFKTTVNPLISKKQKDNLLSALEDAKKEAKVIHLDRSGEFSDDATVGPVILEVDKDMALNKSSFAHFEFFAPVVHIIGYDDIDDAIKIFNSTNYALTGGVFSQSNDDLDYISTRVEVGNLYFNRSNTGARVAIEPFGGFKLSGTGPKAGSKEYLFSFLNLKESHKGNFSDFYEYTQGFDIESAKFDNLYIPGQINFDKMQNNLGKGIFIINKELTDNKKIEILAAIKAGNDVHVYSNEHQKALTKLFGKNIKLVHHFDDIQYGYFDFLICDDLETLKEHTTGFVASSTTQLKKVYEFTDYGDEYYLYIYKYAYPTSFAVNIMRHGAPMEIQ
ncbi:MAG: bifunctional proline dehydrogenase/L-glutamate gamma-semialdehyde dehydrogenase [Bacteriovoracaceae bacterium]|jgi:RHH-type proline utilization regulon transcriptional repressor/proline dehydrogenase/delta 1-pyrroline-5-carboxylate dehydrogenase|nr:bifunctional proline dehydrogenase/L-glutamate gamma-semialdehyde dehydrogenase [Bacteriovoracaceae bacterium]